MNNLLYETEFYNYMKFNGPQNQRSKTNYISWLRFINSFYYLNETLTQNNIDNICITLKNETNTRDIYKKDKDISNIKSALNKYYKFIQSMNNNSILVEDLSEILDDIPTIKLQEIEARVGHGQYRKKLIALWQMCSLSEYKKIDFLIASHIKPWRKSSNFEKTDPYNGLLLKPNIDKLFDSGYISFDEEGKIIISSLLTDIDITNMGISRNMRLIKIYDENKKYLEYHRDNIFIF